MKKAPHARGFFHGAPYQARQGLPCCRPTYCLDANTPARHANANIEAKTIAIAQSHTGKCAATILSHTRRWCPQVQEMEFFTQPNVREKLIAASRAYELYRPENERAKIMSELVKHTIDDIIKNSDFYDKTCEYTIALSGSNLLSRLPQDEKQISNNSRDITFLIIHRLLCEVDFHVGTDIHSTVGAFFDDTNSKIDKLPEDIRSRIINNRYSLPSEIIKELLRSESGKAILEFKKNTQTFDDLQKKSHQELIEHTQKIEKLKTALESYEQAFNFVGLHDGFKNLHKKKTDEKDLSFWGMVFIFTVMLFILYRESTWAQSIIATESTNLGHMAIVAMPLVAIEILLIYLFRVVLANYQSIKKQLLQIELRMTLCQFIQSYTDYANKMKAADKASLEKFENLIFSGIVMDDQQLPSTFDGIEQISKMMSALKSGPK